MSARRELEALARRVRNLCSRAILRRVDETATMRAVQVEALAGETLDQVEHWEPYGYSAKPHAGAEVLLMSAGGKRGQAVAVAVGDRRYRVTGLQSGEVAIYDDQGQRITLYRDRVEIAAPLGFKVVGASTFVGPVTFVGNGTLQGNWDVDGTITATVEVQAQDIKLTTHRTSGVVPGGGISSVPVP